MNRFDKWFLRNKDKLPGVLGVVVITWLGTHFLDWIAQRVTSDSGALSKALKYRINVSLFALLLSLVVVFTLWNFYLSASISKRKLRILRAVYGANDSYVDITSELNSRVTKDDRLIVLVDNTIAGDPLEGVGKYVHVEYEFGGENKTIKVPESQILRLP